MVGLEAHAAAHSTHTAAHAAHSTTAAAGGCAGLRLGFLYHQALGGEHHAGDRGCVLDRGAGHLGRVDDTLSDQVAEGAGRRGVSRAVAADRFDDHAAFYTGVVGDLAGRLFEGAADDVDTNLLIAFALEAVECADRVEKRDSATGDDSLFDRGTGR